MTGLSLDDVVALNALIVTAIGLSFALGRKGKKHPMLDLSSPKRLTAMDEINRERAGRTGTQVKGSVYGASALQRLEDEEFHSMATHGQAHERQLNVFFNWNGHTWDAYEVLGLPAGASREMVIQAFRTCRAKSPDSTSFLQAAADAILKR
ncbi:MAG: hypothetical protein RBT63_00025 [Bdellovibrionales bacterium]|jgi:hypothetical protein|nr:hypothetical protein [Bdellovibrionales bacterium]